MNARPRPSSRPLLVLALATSALHACAHNTTHVDAPLPQTTDLRVGDTHLRAVLQTLGPPSQLAALPSGYTFVYEHNIVDERQLGFSVPESPLQYFKLAGAKARLKHTCWVLTFNDQGTLTGLGAERWDHEFGGAAALQIIVSEKSLVDSSAVTAPAAQHAWGLSSLARLPITLNTANSLTQGAQGLEQSLSPPAMGQHTLEMHNPAPRMPRKRQ